MRAILFTGLPAAIAGPASAHVGHLGEAAGHDHWVAGAALGGAVLAWLWAARKGRRTSGEGEAEGASQDAEPDRESEA